jgi:hypothetical protein
MICMLCLPDSYIPVVLDYPVPVNGSYQLNLADRALLITKVDGQGTFGIEDVYGNLYRNVESDTPALEAYVDKHFVQVGAFWINPAAILRLDYSPGDGYQVRTHHAHSQSFQAVNGEALPVLAERGLTQISESCIVNLAHGMFLIPDENELGLFDPKPIRPCCLRVEADFLNRVVLAVVMAGWTAKLPGDYRNPYYTDAQVEAQLQESYATA